MSTPQLVLGWQEWLGLLAQFMILSANLLLLINLMRTAASSCCSNAEPTDKLFIQPATLEAHAS